MTYSKASLGLAVSFFLAGCQSTHLLYVHSATVGIDVGVGTEGTTKLSFGYDRETFSIIPAKQGTVTHGTVGDTQSTGTGKRGVIKDAQGNDKDAMSLSAVSCVYAEKLSKVRFNHIFVSGKPAVYIAKDPDRLREFRAAVYGGTDKCD